MIGVLWREWQTAQPSRDALKADLGGEAVALIAMLAAAAAVIAASMAADSPTVVDYRICPKPTAGYEIVTPSIVLATDCHESGGNSSIHHSISTDLQTS